MKVSTVFANVHVLFPQHCVSVVAKLLVSDGTADNEDVDVVATDEIDMDVEGVGEDNEDVDVGGVATDEIDMDVEGVGEDNEDVDVGGVATDEIDMDVEGVGEDNEDVDVGGVPTDDVKYGAAVWLHCAHHADATDVADAKSCTMLHDAIAQFAIAWMARLKCALLQIQSEPVLASH
jgi:hypothetical protein